MEIAARNIQEKKDYIHNGCVLNVQDVLIKNKKFLYDKPITAVRGVTVDFCGDWKGVFTNPGWITLGQNCQSFTCGWWLNNDGETIDGRLNYSQVPTSAKISRKLHLCYTLIKQHDGKFCGSFYVNGKLNKSIVAPSTNVLETEFTYIGCGAPAGTGDGAEVYADRLMVYDGILTQSEIENNYIIDKERFGL